VKNTLVVISDCERKIWDREPERLEAPASEAFISRYFISHLAFGRLFGSEVRVLSAKYGLIPENFLVKNYTDRLSRATERMEVAALQAQVKEQRLYTFNIVLGLGGHKFAGVLAAAFAAYPAQRLCFPFSGLPVGEQQRAISHALWSGRFVLPGEE
jgi:hypothetical protein